MKQEIVTVDKYYRPLYEGDWVLTQYGRVCKIVWHISNDLIGWDLEPVGFWHYKYPDSETMWNPHYLIKVTNFNNNLIQDIIDKELNGGVRDECNN